jgi:hypothetical protein
MKKGQHQILSTASLLRVLDILVEFSTWADAMKHVGGSERLAFEWRAKCRKAMKENDLSSMFWLEWRGNFDWWANHCGTARREHLIATEAKIRGQAKDGISEPIFGPTGAPVYKENPLYVGRSDQYIRDMEILAPDDDVAWYRLAHDENGHPIQLTKQVNIPAPLRRAVLAAAHPDYRESLDVNVEHSGTVHVAKPLERLASEPRADVSELRRLAAMTPEQRRAELGGSKYPKNPKTGLVMAAQTGLGPSTDGRPDHIREQQPVALNAPNAPRPSYAKPQNSGERTGRGIPPEGGFKIR